MIVPAAAAGFTTAAAAGVKTAPELIVIVVETDMFSLHVTPAELLMVRFTNGSVAVVLPSIVCAEVPEKVMVLPAVAVIGAASVEFIVQFPLKMLEMALP